MIVFLSWVPRIIGPGRAIVQKSLINCLRLRTLEGYYYNPA